MEYVLRTWGIALCTAAVAAGLAAAAVPRGPLARSLRYVLGLYILLVVVSPFVSLAKGELPGAFYFEETAARREAQAAYDESVLNAARTLARDSLCELLAQQGIESDVQLTVSMDGDGRIYCDSVLLFVANEAQRQTAAALVYAQLGVEPQIIERRG